MSKKRVRGPAYSGITCPHCTRSLVMPERGQEAVLCAKCGKIIKVDARPIDRRPSWTTSRVKGES